MSLPFKDNWIDNKSSTRPTNYSDIFELQVSKAGEAWTKFPTDSTVLQQTYGITSAPKLNASSSSNIYTFTGLPGVDMEKNVLEYRVVCKAPANYTVDNMAETSFTKAQTSQDEPYTVTMRQSHDYTAYVEWSDDGDADHLRPATTTDLHLRLYSRNSDNVLTEITNLPWDWTIPQNGNKWTLTVHGLPKYTDGNEEIEYFLVHGEDTVTGGVETVTTNDLTTSETGIIYTPHYSNGTSSHANDELRCHDGGTIKMPTTSTRRTPLPTPLEAAASKRSAMFSPAAA